ncbi:TPA: hypothetical protein ACPSKB_003036 [Legionella feeleii]|nr:hypothetical protein [Legionella feeleii]
MQRSVIKVFTMVIGENPGLQPVACTQATINQSVVSSLDAA